MKSETSATPSSDEEAGKEDVGVGQIELLLRAPVEACGASWKRPPFSSSSSPANIDGESKYGKHMKSIEPSMPTRATVCSRR